MKVMSSEQARMPNGLRIEGLRNDHESGQEFRDGKSPMITRRFWPGRISGEPHRTRFFGQWASPSSWILLLLLLPIPLLPSIAHAQRAISLDFASGWEQHTQGAWRMRFDHRGLLAMRHPWTESQKGGSASLHREISVPSDWREPISLAFYCTDDYQAEGIAPDASWLTAEGFIGHRFKQVLVDGRVVWSADVADPCPNGTPSGIRVPLPVKPGQKFLLSLLAYDALDSRTPSEKDFYQPGDSGRTRQEDPGAFRFQTHIYWGDVALLEEGAEWTLGKRPSEKDVNTFHRDHWPLPPLGEPWSGPIILEVSKPAGVPKEGFPARCGIPLRPAQETGANQAMLRVGKRRIQANKTVSSQWPDNSAQWLLFDFPVFPDTNTIELAFTPEKNDVNAYGRIKPLNPGIAIEIDDLRFKSVPDSMLDSVCFRNAPAITEAHLSALVEGAEIRSAAESFSIVDDGPFRHTVLIEGRIDNNERVYAHYRMYLSVYRRLPYLLCRLQLINDTGKPLPLAGLRMAFTFPENPTEPRVPSGPVGGEFTLRQISENDRRLNESSVNPKTPFYVAWRGGAVAMRHFRELFPKSASLKDKTLVIDLAAAESSPIVFTPGEAKTHEVWLAFGDVDPVAFSGAVSCPPILQNPAYFCSTGAFGPAWTSDVFPALRDATETAYTGKTWEDLGQKYGLRDFPDSPYYGGLPKWSNNYYERMLGLWSEWLIGNGRAWFDRAFEVCRHVADVAIIRCDIPGKDWRGALHGPGDNHVAGPWHPNLRTEGLAWFAHLTGEPDIYDAVVAAADYCIRVRAAMDNPSVRDHAGPLDAVYSAFALTRDPKYMDEEALRVKRILEIMDVRRGAWAETHGSQVYKGNVPWMMAQLARPLYLWYRATGDVQAAQALVGMADAIVCENTDWDTPGAVAGYSHNPRYAPSSNYDLIILPVIFAAHELTRDPFFLDAARAQWDRLNRAKTFDSPLNCFWNAPWLMYGIKRQAAN